MLVNYSCLDVNFPEPYHDFNEAKDIYFIIKEREEIQETDNKK